MGNQISQQIPEAHLRIYKNVCGIQSPATRIKMLETLLQGQEYVTSAKYAGIYGPILSYIASIRRGDAAILPGESQLQSFKNGSGIQQPIRQENRITQRTSDPSHHTQAISFFTQCLQILGLEEEVALNEEALKSAYKKASLRAHPDKGGSEEAFDSVTRAYAYLGEILRRIRGGRSETIQVSNESPASLTSSRGQTAEQWKMTEPVKLNPKSLNMDTFNKVFEETRLPDPDSDGYGDWLKGGDSNEGPKEGTNKFSGKFNREVFNSAFENELRSRDSYKSQNQISLLQPQALMMAPTMGIELGRERPDDYTASNLNGLKYTDLKNAYTKDSTFSHQVAGVQVASKSLESARMERKAAPPPLNNAELAAIAEGERQQAIRQRQQAIRIAEEDKRNNEYFERMKRYVITNQ